MNDGKPSPPKTPIETNLPRTLEPRSVRASQSQMAEVIFPNDANPLGNLMGGRLMQLIDVAGAMAAHRHSRSYVVTASMDHLDFLAPVHVGDLLVLKSSVNRAFKTSMEIGVKCWVENYITGQTRHISSAYLTFVAVDLEGRRLEVPPVIPESPEEQRRYDGAGRRREHRMAEQAERKQAARK
ncbi:MAG: acyl-CoA thioesterase [Candidatus Koribacter versatilis]|uniref:Acyl-CoA thioesterase n=1 Tax=Candidatus Korobacter versatilis TaxID=658062 RepID=A0A932A9F9_9BACT|nr:acyl-CoA thioesterase [Candidatus Koribacter versatilis]